MHEHTMDIYAQHRIRNFVRNFFKLWIWKFFVSLYKYGIDSIDKIRKIFLRISIKPDYKKLLGRGSFGYVYKGQYGKQEVAVKTINKHMLMNKGKYKNIDKNEIIPFLKGLNHPNIVSIFAFEDHDYEIWLALELCDSSLDKYVQANEELSDILTCELIKQGAQGVAYLHANNIIHRDLRPDNLLILIKDPHPIIKITDFSLCKDLDDQPSSSMTTVWGNPYWRAPELLTEDGQSSAVVRYKRTIDVFSFALVILYMCVNATGREIINKVSSGKLVKNGEDVLLQYEDLWRSPELKEKFLLLLWRMLALVPKERPTIDEVFSPSETPSQVTPRPGPHPPEVSTPPTLQLFASNILRYAADNFVGIGGDNLLILSSEHPETLYLLQMRDDHFHEVWRKRIPSGGEWGDRKYIVDEAIITRGGNSDPTQCWDLKLKREHEHKVGDLELVSCLSSHVMLYSKKMENSYQLVLRGCAVPPLCPPPTSPWQQWLSVCRHPSTGWLAVCEASSLSLDVFDAAGRHQHHINLSYPPAQWNAISCTDSHIIVSEFQSILILTWSGQELVEIDLQQRLELDEYERVESIGVCGSNLYVVIGRAGYVVSLHALRIM